MCVLSSGISLGSSCRLEICKCSTDVCQLRLDFETFALNLVKISSLFCECSMDVWRLIVKLWLLIWCLHNYDFSQSHNFQRQQRRATQTGTLAMPGSSLLVNSNPILKKGRWKSLVLKRRDLPRWHFWSLGSWKQRYSYHMWHQHWGAYVSSSSW